MSVTPAQGKYHQSSAQGLIDWRNMKAVKYMEYGGVDWHDSREITDQLEEDGTFSINNPEEVIAKHMYGLISGMCCETEKQGVVIRRTQLESYPSYEDVLEAVVNGKKIFLTSPEEIDQYGSAHELEFTYDPEKNSVYYYYGYGQVDYHGTYDVSDIPDDNVHYIVVENFLAPTKGVPTIQRMFHEPYSTESEARTAKDELKLHDNYDTRAEILVTDKESDIRNVWYDRNIRLVELMGKYPNVPFSCFTEEHLNNFIGGVK